MRHRITIERIEPEIDTIKIYEQIVDEIDLHAVMQAINKRPRKSRAKGERKDEK